MKNIYAFLVLSIALQCPYEGGAAVYYARNLYQLANDSLYFDDTICAGVQEHGGGDSSTGSNVSSTITIQPNPASGTAKVVFPSERPRNSEQRIVLKLVNQLGQPVLERSLQGNETQFILELQSLPNGIYTCFLVEAATTHSCKLLVQH